MAINVSFNGATIYKPGAYSKTTIDLGGAFPLGPAGLVGIIGESTRGIPGSEEQDIGNNVYTAAQVPEIIAKYGSGPIVDACNFLFSPAVDGAIPNGAQAVYIYKTNASVKASLTLANNMGYIKSIIAGEEGNRIVYSVSHTAEVAPVVTGTVALNDAACAALPDTAFNVKLNGGATQAITVLSASVTDQATLLTELNNDLTGVTASFDASDYLVFTVDADATAHQNGLGKSFEIETSVDLAAIGHAAGITFSSIESAATITIEQRKELITETDTIGGNIVLTAEYIGAGTAASVTVDHDSDYVRLTVDAANTDYKISSYDTLIELVNDLNLEADWVFALSSTLYNQLSPSVLDAVSAVSALNFVTGNKPVRIKKDYYEFVEFCSESAVIYHQELDASQTITGLPEVKAETFLNTVVGALGATTGASVTNALLAFEGIRLNAVVPLFSRDATADIADGLTDSSSTYTIDAVHQGVKTHLSKMATTKNRSERQGYLSWKGYFSTTSSGYTSGDTCLDIANNLAYGRVQLCIQDVRNIDSQGNIKWFQPWALACNIAGARAGSPIGTPLTNKYMNVAGIRHTAQPMRTAEVDIETDFDPRTQYEQAIKNGITFLEAPQSGGFKVTVDNTTYGKDGNWVWNRGNVIYAADILAFDFRDQLEKIYVGVKNTVNAAEVKSTCESILATYLSQGITVQSDDAPNGFKSLVVKIEGNTINISVIAKLVEGIDFVLADITLSRKISEA